MPTPHKGQTEKEYMGICMGYPDMQKYEASQRAAICHSKWKEHLKAMAEEWGKGNIGESENKETSS